MATRDDRDIAWCVFRNLVHAVYREARHVGPPGDPDAKLVIPDVKQRVRLAPMGGVA